MSHKNGKDWGEPFNLGAPVNTSYWESQPAISPDGSTLYFVSNRPGGLGGYDIWKSMLKADGYWSQPENLGPEINTPYDEHTPFIHPDGKTLYFSSDGWPGMMMVNGFGALFGSFTSGFIIDKFFTHTDQSKDWHSIWITFASYTLLLAIVFPFVFKYKHNKAEEKAIEAMRH